MVKKIDKVISGITGAICYVSIAAIVLTMLLTVIDVLTRKLMRTGIVGSYELTERLLLVMIFAAFAYTQTKKGHVHVTLFLSKFPKSLGVFIFGILGLLSTGAAVFCAYAITEQGKYSLTAGTLTAVLHIPLYPFYYIAAFCMYVFAITLLWDAIKCFIGLKNDEVCTEIRSSWE